MARFYASILTSFFLVFPISSCKHARQPQSELYAVQPGAESGCNEGIRAILRREKTGSFTSNTPAFKASGYVDKYEPKGIGRLAGESSSDYVARLEAKLAEVGGVTDLEEMKSLKTEWTNSIATRFKLDDPEKLTATLKRDGVQSMTDEEYKLFSAEFSRNRVAYKGMLDFLGQSDHLYERLHEIELKIRIEMRTASIDHTKALEIVLARIEKKGGFGAVVDLPAKSFSSGEWWAMLREGKPFRDINFSSSGRSGHGIHTHRMQFAAIIQDMESNPDRYFEAGKAYSVDVKNLFSFMGSEKLRGRLVFSESPDFTSLFNTFDAFSNSGSCPEYFHELYAHGIGGTGSLP
jgi:hypothetical protein